MKRKSTRRKAPPITIIIRICDNETLLADKAATIESVERWFIRFLDSAGVSNRHAADLMGPGYSTRTIHRVRRTHGLPVGEPTPSRVYNEKGVLRGYKEVLDESNSRVDT